MDLNLIHSDHRLDVESRHQEDVVDFRHWDPSVFTDSGLGTERRGGCVYVLCTYVCLCKKKKKIRKGQKYTSTPFLYLLCTTTL